MAARTARMFSGNPTLTMFEFDLEEAQSSELKVKVFKEPDWEWARFVMSNRDINTTQPCHDYDIVIGPVADDTIARLLRLYTENFINEEQLLHEIPQFGDIRQTGRLLHRPVYRKPGIRL